MKCSKCGYDYPAKETKCPYCGEPNKLGMEWEKEEDETRKETLLTKAKVLHSMPLYVANKIMNIILLLAVVLLVVLFLVFFILGYVDEKRMENGTFIGEDYFEHLLAEIREIRLSKRRFYQKLTDIYATAVDYNRDAPTTRLFYKKVQNKIHFAVHGHTAAELIVERADAGKEHMGLTTWENAPDGKIVQYSEELPEWCGIGRYGKIGQLRFGYGRENGRQAYSDDYGRLG